MSLFANMEPEQAGFLIGLVIGIVLVSIVPAVIILTLGISKRKVGLGIGGFFACLFGGLILGFLLSGPLFGLFLWLILKQPQQQTHYGAVDPVSQYPPNQFPS